VAACPVSLPVTLRARDRGEELRRPTASPVLGEESASTR
jgi:hypothetical protein